MKHSIAVRAVAVLLALGGPAGAAEPVGPLPPVAPAPTAPPGAATVAGNPSQVLRETLPNGLRVVIVPDRLAPVVSTQLVYLAGSNDAPPGFPGTAHALEHMMFRGSEGLDKDQLFELGALLGGLYNASTEETVTTYTYTVPAADLGVVLHIEALRMNGASLTQDGWEQERGAIDQEVSRDLSMPTYNMFSQIQAALFRGSPYENDALGSRPSFERTDAALLRQFYERWYAPNNAILVVAGDVDPAQAMGLVRTAFAAVPRRPVPNHAPVAPGPVTPATLSIPSNLPVGLAALAIRMPGFSSPDFAAADILGDIIGSPRGDMYALVPAGRALQAQFGFTAKTDVGMGLAIGAFPADADPAPLLADMRGVLTKIASGDFPDELVEASKRQEVAQLAFAADSINGLARSWARALSVQGLDSPEDLARAYGAVTPAQVRRLARQVLDPDPAVTAILTPRGGSQPAASAGFGGAETVGTPPDHAVVLPDWATTALAAASAARGGAPDAGTAPDVTVLPNGLRLIVQPEHVSPTVSVFGRVRNEPALQEPPGKEGVAALTEELLGFGTTSLDRLAFRRALDDIAAQEHAGFDFSLKVLTAQFGAGMRLLADNLLHPAFPPDALPVMRRQAAQSLAGQKTSPVYLFDRAQQAATLPPGDPSLREATPDTVGGLTIEDVRAYHAAAMRPDLATVVVIGDITPAAARDVVEQAFGGWHAEGPAPNVDLPPVAPRTDAVRERVADNGSLQDQVALTQRLALPVASPDRWTFLLGNTILGNSFSSRLYRDLRIRTGYVYGVSSSPNFIRTRGRYTISFGADPAKVEPARNAALRDIEDMQKNPVGDAELARAKTQILRLLSMQRASVGAIAGQYLRQVELGLPLNPEAAAAAHYQATTAEDIRRVFAQYLDPKAMAEIVRGPPAAN